MRLRYSAAARRHLEAIYDFIAERNPSAAQRVIAEIRASARLLIEFPHMGRAGDVRGTREWVIRGSPYLVVYEINVPVDEIWVLGVFHGAQNRLS
jgi:toxin ParE1/3/4